MKYALHVNHSKQTLSIWVLPYPELAADHLTNKMKRFLWFEDLYI